MPVNPTRQHDVADMYFYAESNLRRRYSFRKGWTIDYLYLNNGRNFKPQYLVRRVHEGKTYKVFVSVIHDKKLKVEHITKLNHYANQFQRENHVIRKLVVLPSNAGISNLNHTSYYDYSKPIFLRTFVVEGPDLMWYKWTN